jgi:hypothetical protein
MVRELAELLGPWSSARALAEAPQTVVQDLVKRASSLENSLHRGASRTARMATKIVLAAGVACGTGLAASFLFRWISNYGARGISDSLMGVGASLATTIQESSFGERFAVAVVVSWALGTWLLSNVYKS